jgi:cytochrome c oxidase subunit 2
MIRRLGALTLTGWVAAMVVFGGAADALAQAAQGPVPWQLGLQEPASERMTRIVDLHNFVLWIITAICIFVLALLVWIAVRYNAKANPTPTATTHNTTLEVLWTVIPVAILVAIAIPSFRLLYYEDVIPPADITIKAIGKQWYWSYEYPDNGNFTFDALMLADRVAAQQGVPRLLGTNNHVVVPINKTVRIITTGADVIHAWTIPAFGVKIDAVPGKLNQTWFNATREGTFYGECSELCGARHAFMPITVEVVSQERFDQWVAEARTKFATVGAPTRLAEERR